ncbi:hypothetical protein P43SY_002106 [Pythium insidiosum]|uniref:SGNH hydrolase-type esterase domain-containing protein n=1 Tax=Pythium insidiosum TaxID=114742 RepID=A0AAD5LSM1_PYTIN|nr:hypothetical protein P43SY_002106 [Pythium insidiosum]
MMAKDRERVALWKRQAASRPSVAQPTRRQENEDDDNFDGDATPIAEPSAPPLHRRDDPEDVLLTIVPRTQRPSVLVLHRKLSRMHSPPSSSPGPSHARSRRASVVPSRAAPPSATRPRSTMSPHATHAMALHLQEYQQRVELACATTYDRALRPPSSAPARPSSFCRARILESNRALFRSSASASPPPPFSAPVDLKRAVQRATDAHTLPFHHMTARRLEFLYGPASSSARDAAALASDAARSAMAKDHYALGPGQYEVVQDPRLQARPAAVKFSPSDRFHESYSTDRPGPGQYLTSESQTTARPVAAVFSQRPRETELGTVTSPTANVVSSYYYVPASAFEANGSAAQGWPRTPRFKRKERERLLAAAPKAPGTPDFAARNRRELTRASALVRQRRRRQQQQQQQQQQSTAEPEEDDEGLLQPADGGADAPVRRRSSFLAATAEAPAKQPLLRLAERDRLDLLLRSWITVAWLAAFQQRMSRFLAFTRRVRRVAATQRQRRLQLTFDAWKLLDEQRHRAYAAHLVAKNAFRWRLMVRIRRRARHATMLRQFLGGLSIDVRFALAMKRIKRKIMLLQRWWRHVQLMVRAREEALFHKWIAVENRLRLEYISQMPHLQRIFQAPNGTGANASGSGASGSSANQSGASASGASNAQELQLHKLLNLPDQKRWFPARFVLHSDGSLRGYAADGSNELLVEVKNFRCHFHDVADATGATGGAHGDADDRSSVFSSSASLPLGDNGVALHAYSSYTNAAWKPFLMVFRQGAFRFVLLASSSHLPTEIMSWKDKLERLATATPTTSGSISVSGSFLHPQASSLGLLTAASGYSNRGSLTTTDETDSMATQSSPSPSRSPSLRSSVSEFVEVTMQSGLLAPASASPHAPPTLEAMASTRSVGAARGKFQARVRTVRQRHKSGLVVTEGPLSYYVVDLLRDFPKVPSAVISHTIREKLREKRKAFRAEIYRYKLELHHFHQHQAQIQNMHVLDKFRDFFVGVLSVYVRARALGSGLTTRLHVTADTGATAASAFPQSHFQPEDGGAHPAVEQVKATTPPNPRYLLDSSRSAARELFESLLNAFSSRARIAAVLLLICMALAPQRPTVVLVGDSLTQQGADPRVGGWAALLTNHLVRSTDVVNRGLSGYNTRWFVRDVLPSLSSELEKLPNVAVITLWLGANDAALADGPSRDQHVPLPEFQANLRTLVTEFHRAAPDAKILLITPPVVDDDTRRRLQLEWAAPTEPLNRRNDVAQQYAAACVAVARDMAATGWVSVLDVHTVMTERYPEVTERATLLSDGLHFSREGNRLVFELVLERVQALLPMRWQFPDWKTFTGSDQ